MISDLTERHRAEEFRRFLNLVDRSVPAELDVHVIVDNSSTHKTPAIHRWLVRHPRFSFHFTPTYSSWLNLVERWFAELTERWLRRGSHRSTKELVASIRTWIELWNEDPRPFVWHKSADEILQSLAAYCQRISDSYGAALGSEMRRRRSERAPTPGCAAAAVHPAFILRGDNYLRPADEAGPAGTDLRTRGRGTMNRRIVTWVATGAVVLGIGAAGVGAVVANSNASAKNSAPVAAAAMTTQSTSATTSTPTASSTQGGVVGAQMGESDEGQAQMMGTAGSAQSSAAQNGGNALEAGSAASQAQGG